MALKKHECGVVCKTHTATEKSPYLYTGSGLSNVFLAGIKYCECKICGAKAADIPALNQLLKGIARTIVSKKSNLSGEELRFLRKRLGKRAIDFATMIGITPEYLSKCENGHEPLSRTTERFVRLVYGVLSQDKELQAHLETTVEEWLTTRQSNGKNEKILAMHKRRGNQAWEVETRLQKAA